MVPRMQGELQRAACILRSRITRRELARKSRRFVPPLHSSHTSLGMGRYGSVFLLQGGEFQRPWKRCSMVAKWPLEVEIAMGTVPVPISVSSGHFALRYEVPKFLPRGPFIYGCAYHNSARTIAIAGVYR